MIQLLFDWLFTGILFVFLFSIFMTGIKSKKKVKYKDLK